MRAVVLILLDGLGDRGHPSLGGRSTNEAADTPSLDALAASGSSGLLWPLGRGRTPSSELSHWRLLGAPATAFPGRAVLEALGRQLPVRDGEVLGFAALRPARREGDRLWLRGRPGDDDRDDCEALLAAVDGRVVGQIEFRLHPLGRGEAILRLSGPASAAITDTDPFGERPLPVLLPQAIEPAAEATAAAVAGWTASVARRLVEDPVNRRRARDGAEQLTAITTKWWGCRREAAAAFSETTGMRGAILAASPFLGGLGRALDLTPVVCAESEDPAVDLTRRLQRAWTLLDGGHDFVLCHLKALDEAGHTKDPDRRIEVLERIDRALADALAERFADVVVAVTGDHATPASGDVIHSGDPVPFIMRGPGVRTDRVHRFGELDAAAGMLGHFDADDVLPLLLNAADRSLFLGSRPTPVDGALGSPPRPPALRLP